jgi:hypothetical protein
MISSQSRHSARTVQIQRLAWELALGACTGVMSTSAPSERKMSSKLRVNFASRSRMRKAHLLPSLSDHKAQVAGLLSNPSASGLAVTPARWTR